jgi:hypothetical protein
MIVEAILASVTVITVSSLVFVRKIMNDEDKLKKLNLEIETISSSKEVRTCPYCNWHNGSTKENERMIATGVALFPLRNKKQDIPKINWAGTITHGPCSGIIAITPDGQRLWQMCSHCFAEWYCSKPEAIDELAPWKD